MESMTIGGAVFLLKVPSRTEKAIPQVYYNRNNDPVTIMPGTPRWNEMMGRYKIAEYFVSPELWEAARSVDNLKSQLFKGAGEISIAVKLTEGGLGDMLMLTAVPKAFKEAFGSQVKIVVFTCEDLAELLIGNKYVDEVRIGPEGYESKEFALRINGDQLDMKIRTTPEEEKTGQKKNRTNMYLQSLGLWLIGRRPVYEVASSEREWAAKEVGGTPFIAVQTLASNVSKTYLNMLGVVKELEESGKKVVRLDEKAGGKHQYTPRQVGALIELADVVVTPDSFAFHMAGALGKRVVGIFGYTDGEIFAQDYEKAVVVQAACTQGRKTPCWWDIECQPGHTTREKENQGNAHCLLALDSKIVTSAVLGQLVKRPKIMIAMLTFDLLNMTKKALASIRSSYDYDVMVVDNASTDGTQEWLKEQGIWHVSKQTSVAAAQNIAMREFLNRDYDLFVFLNNDVVLRGDYIDKLVEAQVRTKSWGIVGATSEGVAPWAVDDIKLGPIKDAEIVDIPASSFSATLLTRECIEKVGMFDETFFPRYIEDNDYTLRIRLAGGSFWMTNQAVFYHVLGAVVNTKPTESQMKNQFWQYNLAKFHQKWGIEPHEPQLFSKLGIEWFPRTHGRSIRSVIEECHDRKKPVVLHRNMGGWGDVVFASVIARELKYAFPGLEVVYAFREPYMFALKGNPHIDKLVPATMLVSEFGHFDLTDLEFRVELLEQERFGKIVSSRTKIYLDVFGIWGLEKPDYFVLDEEKDWARREWGAREYRIAIVPEGSNGTKNWPSMPRLLTSFVEAEPIVLDKRYSFREAASLISEASVVISPDTGLSNVAGALGIPTVAVFGNRSGKPFERMFGQKFKVVRGACRLAPGGCDYFLPCLGHAPSRVKEMAAKELDCMKALTLEEVVKAVEEALL